MGGGIHSSKWRQVPFLKTEVESLFPSILPAAAFHRGLSLYPLDKRCPVSNSLLSWAYLAQGLCQFAEPSINLNLSFQFCSYIICWVCGAALSWGKGWNWITVQLDFVWSIFPSLSGWYNDITFYPLTSFIVFQKMSSLGIELFMCLSLPLEHKFQ